LANEVRGNAKRVEIDPTVAIALALEIVIQHGGIARFRCGSVDVWQFRRFAKKSRKDGTVLS
jgi:hypothetical protein